MRTTLIRMRALALTRPGMVLLYALCAVVYIVNLPAQVAYLRALARTALAPATPAGAELATLLRSLGITEGRYVAVAMTLLVAAVMTSLVVGGLILWRRVDDWMALITTAMMVGNGVVGPLTLTHAASALGTTGPWRLLSQCVTFVALLSTGMFFLLFPSGAFIPRWMRWLLVAIIPLVFFFAFLPSVLFAPPFALPSNAVVVGLALCVVYGQIYRYRRTSSAVQRQQTKWVSLALISSVIAYIVETLAPWLFAPLRLSGAQITFLFTPVITFFVQFGPLCVGIAITRYHLWSIDVIIRRTLIYGSLTAVLAAGYFSVVVLAQTVAQRLTGLSGGQPILIVGTTLIFAALVAPLRRRIQALIDRAFYRGRYDATVTLADFGAKLRTATDLEALREDLMSVVWQTMRPEHVTLWLAQRSRPTAEQDMPAPHAGETELYPTRASVSSSKSGGW